MTNAILSKLIEHPSVFLNVFVLVPLPSAALAYGVIWAVLRSKNLKERQSFFWHSCGVATTVLGAALIRLAAVSTFAGSGAYEFNFGSGTAILYLLVIPAAVAFGYIVWFAKPARLEKAKERYSETLTKTHLILAIICIAAGLAILSRPASEQSARAEPDPETKRNAAEAPNERASRYPVASSQPLQPPTPVAVETISVEEYRRLIVGRWICTYTEGAFKGSAYPVVYRKDSTYSSSTAEPAGDPDRWEILSNGSLVEISPSVSTTIRVLNWESSDQFVAYDSADTKRCFRGKS